MGRRVAISLGFVAIAVILQANLFGPGRIQPFGASPALVMLSVIAVTRYLDEEPALLIGFTGGLLQDLLGSQPLGLWALVLTVVAYATVATRDRVEGLPLVAGSVALLTIGAMVLFVVLATLFAQDTLQDQALAIKVILPAVYNVAIAGAVLPLATKLLRQPGEPGWAI
ncbi:MAG: rod shape-determining protein MreD [Acidimicrobiia bacterium]|nr:rod shape-determining protein MreD [Acidimicrobiia bacterium]MBT8213582.1 rod shape-determining protein MreD [Acidimicrobiia bacterium]